MTRPKYRDNFKAITPAAGTTALAEQEQRHQVAVSAADRRRREQQGSQHIPQYGEPGRLTDPEWVIVGCKVDAGIRLYASRDIDAKFWLQQIAERSQECDWELTATMRDMLIVTKPTYPEALAELQRLWAARDRAAGIRHGITTGRKAITQ
jgi:hypothetical protein